MVAGQALIDAIFGYPPDPALARNKDAARCQLEMLKQANTVEYTVLKQIIKAKKTALREAATDSASALAAELEGVFSSDETEKAGEKLERGAEKKCAELGRPDLLFPGTCGEGNPNLSEVEACVIAAARCQVCLKINAFDGLSLNCERLDDGDAANASCP